MKNNNTISNEIRSYFKLKGWTYADAAKILGCSKQTVANRICGKKFGPNTARRWAEAFGFNEDFLLTGKGKLTKNIFPNH